MPHNFVEFFSILSKNYNLEREREREREKKKKKKKKKNYKNKIQKFKVIEWTSDQMKSPISALAL